MKRSLENTVEKIMARLGSLIMILLLFVVSAPINADAKPLAVVQPVTSLTATAASGSQINLKWAYAYPGDISGFYLERSANASSGFQTVATVGATATLYSNTSLASGTTYYYRIRAYSKIGSKYYYSSYSPVASATTQVVDTTAPSVSITSPTSGTSISSAQTVSITASAQDNVGVSKVEFYDGTTLKGTDTTSPFGFAWAVSNADNGNHSLTAKAYDAAGNSKVSSTVTASVNIPTLAPGAFEFSAGSYSVGEGGGKVVVTIRRVGGSDGAVTVDFRTGLITAKNGEDYVGITLTTLSFASGETQKTINVGIIDDAVVEGDETFKVLLSNSTGGATLGTTISSVITIRDNDAAATDTTAPTVAISSPASGTAYASAQTVTISVTAQDNVAVSKVELYDGNILKGTDTTSPYGFSWTVSSADNGSHSLTARAYDAAGNSSTSAAVALSVNIPAAPVGPLPVFPGAEGFGTLTPAGRGGKIIKVTNLNDSGTGSLRAAIDATGARIVVFEVGGTIQLATDLSIRNPYITIAGQTAPSPGIMLKGAGLRVTTHDILVQHLRIRVGDDPNGPTATNRDGFQILGTGAYNVVMDHVSSSWGIDETASTWYPLHDVTISNCIISEGLVNNYLNTAGPGGKGILVGTSSKNVTLIRNLLAHNDERNPRLNGDTVANVVNNVFYNARAYEFSAVGSADGPVLASYVGNVFLRGPNTTANKAISIKSVTPAGTKVYQKDNTYDGGPILVDGTGVSVVTTPPVPVDGLTIVPNAQVEDMVLAGAGARPADRDSVDVRVVNEVQTRTGYIISSQSEVGGWPVLPSTSRALVLPSNPNADDDSDGYTNIEEFLHQMAAQVEGRVI